MKLLTHSFNVREFWFLKDQLQMLLEKRGYFRWDPLVANFSEIETNFGRSEV